ncbi:rod shape-determining protein [Planctomycetota bacterium]|nr:rod shape-determining protein [Planctomycetota bacterium]MSR39551.1 rod shape-determining protein [Planctomycetota bacterium]GDY03116.1 rod shape-determining protein [Planctomycetota bacterium]
MVKPIDWLLSRFSVDLGIDLGTANTLVFVREQGIVLDEPSVVAVRKGTNEVLLDGKAVGNAALEYLGRTPPGFQAIRPMKSGVIADFEITERMLRYFMAKASGGKRLIKPRVVIAVPWGITMVEKRAVIGSAERAGARRVFLVDEPTAAAIGAGLKVHEPRGTMIVDIGGGTSEVAVISLANVVTAECLRVAGDDFNDAIAQYIRSKFNLLVGEITAERLKVAAGSCVPMEDEIEVEIRGRDSLTGLPRRAVISSVDVREALMEPVKKVVGAIKSVLERTPPELSSDLVDSGITLAGGGALLRGLADLIARETQLDVRVADRPLECVARGTGIFLENLELYSQFLEGGEDLG